MRRTPILPLLLVLLAAGSRGEERQGTVRALRYQVLTHASALEALHDAGLWRHELYFPEEEVVCNLEETFEVDPDGAIGVRRTINAFFGPIRKRFRERPGGKIREQPVSEVEVPLAIAKRIFELAEVTRRQHELAERAANAIGETDLLPSRLPFPKR